MTVTRLMRFLCSLRRLRPIDPTSFMETLQRPAFTSTHLDSTLLIFSSLEPPWSDKVILVLRLLILFGRRVLYSSENQNRHNLIITRKRMINSLFFPGLLWKYPDSGDFLRVAHCKTNLSYDGETFHKNISTYSYYLPLQALNYKENRV